MKKSNPNEQKTNNTSEGVKSGLSNGLILAIFALISTGLTSFTWLMTKEKIQSEKELALLRAISELVPANEYANDPYRDCTLLTSPDLLGSKNALPAWRLRDEQQKPVAVLISSIAPNGYNGAIELIVGHYSNSTLEKIEGVSSRLAGVRVTNHQETPGLGDKVDTRKSDWILQFAGKIPQNMTTIDWQVKKDGGQFDAFTGATITPRAVLEAISKNNDYFNLYQQQIFSAPSNCPTGNKEKTDE